MNKNKTINKKAYKKNVGKCAICGNSIYETLDVHRWNIEGKDGGKYTRGNSLVLDANCHRLVHAGIIEIEGVFDSTAGQVVIYKDENGEEKIKKIR